MKQMSLKKRIFNTELRRLEKEETEFVEDPDYEECFRAVHMRDEL